MDVGWTESKSVMNARTIAVAGAVAATIALVGVAAGSETVVAIRTTNQAREQYLAHAIIWHAPPDLSPADLVEGPAGVFPYTREQATGDDAIPCTFARAVGSWVVTRRSFSVQPPMAATFVSSTGIRDRTRATERYSRPLPRHA